MSRQNQFEKDVVFIQVPPQARGYEVIEEDAFGEKYWAIYCRNLHTTRVNSPFWEIPGWASLLGGILQCEGMESRFVDISHFCGRQSYFEGEEYSYEKVRSYLSKRIDGQAIALLSPLTLNYALSTQVAKMIKEIDENNIVIFGGSHSSFAATECIRDPNVDFIVRMDGEYNTPELVKCLLLGKDVEHIPGITFKSAMGSVSTPAAPLLLTPRVDFFPKYEFFPRSIGGRVAYLRTVLNRGCPYQCAFCGDIYNNMRPQEYPIEWTTNEIVYLRETFGKNLFYLGDETFTLQSERKRVLEFCEKVGPLGINWIAQTRVNQIDKEVLLAMQKAGCKQVELGCETVSSLSLSHVNKGIQVQEIQAAYEMVKNAGMFAYGYWLVGLPYEDEEAIIKTQDFMCYLIKHDLMDLFNYGILTPYPGTNIYADPKRFGMEILTFDYSKYHEYGLPVHRTDKLAPTQIFNLWRKGLGKFVEIL